jgi:hypothetical protein
MALASAHHLSCSRNRSWSSGLPSHSTLRKSSKASTAPGAATAIRLGNGACPDPVHWMAILRPMSFPLFAVGEDILLPTLACLSSETHARFAATGVIRQISSAYC